MQTECDVFSCKSEVLSLNYCSDGFIVDLADYNEEYVYVYIDVNGFKHCKSVLVENSVAKVDWKPSEYLLRDEYYAEITFKNSAKESIEIIGEDCNSYCGLGVWILPTCEEGYKYLNEKCGVALITPQPEENPTCSWTTIYFNCNWTSKMADRIVFNGKLIKLTNQQKLNGVLNPAYVDELNLIDPDMFSAILVGDNVVTTYIGSADVEIYNGCEKLEKTCV